MKKVIVSTALIFLLSIAGGVRANYSERPQKIIYKYEEFTVSDSFVKDGKIYVPIRELLENMDYNISWNESDGSIGVKDNVNSMLTYYSVAQKQFFNDAISQPASGVFEDGSKYTYTPQENNMSYKDVIESWGYVSGAYRNPAGFSVHSPEAAARIAKIYLKSSGDKDFNITFDSENMAWIVEAVYNRPAPSPPYGIVINCQDGRYMDGFGVPLCRDNTQAE